MPIKNLAYGDDPRQNLDIFPAAREEAPTVMFWYGGGWTTGSKQRYGFVGRTLQRWGYTAVIVNYRLNPQVRFPEFAADGALALGWVYQHIQEYGGNPQKLFLMGHSAGAHTAAHLAYDPQWAHLAKVPRTCLRGYIGLAGPYDLYPARKYRPAFDLSDPAEPWRPINAVKDVTVPALLLNGRPDMVVSFGNAQRMAQRITSLGGEAQVVLYSYLGHRTLMAALARPLAWLPVQRDIQRFIDSHSH